MMACDEHGFDADGGEKELKHSASFLDWGCAWRFQGEHGCTIVLQSLTIHRGTHGAWA